MKTTKILQTLARLGAGLMLVSTSLLMAEPRFIELSKGDKSIAIFGTIHVTKPEWLPLPQPVTEKLANSDVLAVELDATDIKTVAEINKQMMLVGMSATNNVEAIADDVMKQKLNDLLGPMAPGMMKMRPWVAAITVTMMRAKQMGMSGDAIDMVLIQDMKQHKKPVVALEEVSEQMSIFGGLSPEEEKTFLNSSLDDGAFEKEMSMTIDLWQNQNKESEQKLLSKLENETPQLYKSLLVDRNIRMVERVQKLNQEHGKVFMAVGGLHLNGKDGVITLLKKAGYKEK
ncbi:MAG: TraB/GumN family protein [Gammaproteobacteria bacterium]|nr:TraB/GumN family protein [Gammaproteobacteria bacterium]